MSVRGQLRANGTPAWVARTWGSSRLKVEKPDIRLQMSAAGGRRRSRAVVGDVLALTGFTRFEAVMPDIHETDVERRQIALGTSRRLRSTATSR